MILLEPFLDETGMDLLEVDGSPAELEEVGYWVERSIGLRLGGVAIAGSCTEARESAEIRWHGRSWRAFACHMNVKILILSAAAPRQ